MSCIGCEEYAKRITNVNQDDVLKNRFSSLTGITVSLFWFFILLFYNKIYSFILLDSSRLFHL